MALVRRAGIVLAALLLASCQTLGLVRYYEYDERVELSLDGSAVVDITASLAALVALRGATLSVDPEARFDRQALRRLYEGSGVSVREVNPFRRHGRRFVHVRLDVGDIAELPRLVPLSWSRYRLDRLDGELRFVQDVGPAAQVDVGNVGWTGSELVAFRVHLPSRIHFHNSPLDIERGNILVWEQTLRERLSGAPLRMEARMETESILYRTLWLFGGTFIAAMLVLAAIIWWVSRKGRSVVPA
jgi:preprotein translocase subunit Sec61beta